MPDLLLPGPGNDLQELGFMREPDISFETAALTNTGRMRKNNEDRLFTLEIDQPDGLGAASCGIYIVADGMGGHQAGEVASAIAAKMISFSLLQNLKNISLSRFPSCLIKQAINEANREIFSLAARNPDLYSMGTTVTLGFRLDDELYLGQVGDSRAYLIRTNRIQQLTQDHSLVAQLVRKGAITAEQARFHPDRRKILRSLGVASDVTVDTFSQTLLNGDTLVFCSDGLTGNVSDGEILQYILQTDDAYQACERLIDLANFRGGDDNISVIVVRVRPGLCVTG
jgi:PPM family protein phosphatase